MEKYRIVTEITKTGYSAYSPDVPGCIATGATEEEAEKNMLEALKFHFEGMEEDDKGDVALGRLVHKADRSKKVSRTTIFKKLD